MDRDVSAANRFENKNYEPPSMRLIYQLKNARKIKYAFRANFRIDTRKPSTTNETQSHSKITHVLPPFQLVEKQFEKHQKSREFIRIKNLNQGRHLQQQCRNLHNSVAPANLYAPKSYDQIEHFRLFCSSIFVGNFKAIQSLIDMSKIQIDFHLEVILTVVQGCICSSVHLNLLENRISKIQMVGLARLSILDSGKLFRFSCGVFSSIFQLTRMANTLELEKFIEKCVCVFTFHLARCDDASMTLLQCRCEAAGCWI